MLFFRNWSSNDAPAGCHFACSLKNEDVGYWGKLSGVRESELLTESMEKKKVSVLENGGEHWSTSS